MTVWVLLGVALSDLCRGWRGCGVGCGFPSLEFRWVLISWCSSPVIENFNWQQYELRNEKEKDKERESEREKKKDSERGQER